MKPVTRGDIYHLPGADFVGSEQGTRPEDVMESIWRAEAIRARRNNRELSRQLDWMQGLAFWLAMGLIVSAAVFLRAAGWM